MASRATLVIAVICQVKTMLYSPTRLTLPSPPPPSRIRRLHAPGGPLCPQGTWLQSTSLGAEQSPGGVECGPPHLVLSPTASWLTSSFGSDGPSTCLSLLCGSLFTMKHAHEEHYNIVFIYVPFLILFTNCFNCYFKYLLNFRSRLLSLVVARAGKVRPPPPLPPEHVVPRTQ